MTENFDEFDELVSNSSKFHLSMFSRASENGITLELEFLQTPCIRQFFTCQIHLEKRFVKIFHRQ